MTVGPRLFRGAHTKQDLQGEVLGRALIRGLSVVHRAPIAMYRYV